MSDRRSTGASGPSHATLSRADAADPGGAGTDPGAPTGPPVLVVRHDDPLPPYQQVRVQLERMIRSGTLTPDERLPPLRQLAGDLGLAVGTVARSYAELEEAGLVRSRRGAGTRVARSVPALSGPDRDAALGRLVADYVLSARQLGLAREQILAAVAAGLPLA